MLEIDHVVLYHVRMPLAHPFETSFGVQAERDCIIVQVEGQGATGWGECVAAAGPWYAYETTQTAWHILSDFLIPTVLGQRFDGPEHVLDAFARVRGHNMAKAGLEMAIWDLAAKQAGVSLSRRLGGVRNRIPVGVSIGVQESLDALLDRVAGFVEQGYRRVKIKIKPGWDVEVTRAVRKRFPETPLQVDANSAYHLADVEVFRAMDDVGLLLIEQPLAHDDIYAHSRLQRELETDLCLDESIHSVDDARAAAALGSCRIINIKPGRVGGHCSSKLIHDFCQAEGIPVWHGGMLETGIGRAHSVALASLAGFTLPGDISGSARYYHEDIVESPFVLNSDSTLSVPDGAGIGVAVNTDRLHAVTLHRETFAG
ncbi:MAG: o-succinylbenzoate synthase [Anaerolineales bacterium]|nr:o-succinylbenzoate synthase [Anaerolineales bacterium]